MHKMSWMLCLRLIVYSFARQNNWIIDLPEIGSRMYLNHPSQNSRYLHMICTDQYWCKEGLYSVCVDNQRLEYRPMWYFMTTDTHSFSVTKVLHIITVLILIIVIRAHWIYLHTSTGGLSWDENEMDPDQIRLDAIYTVYNLVIAR